MTSSSPLGIEACARLLSLFDACTSILSDSAITSSSKLFDSLLPPDAGEFELTLDVRLVVSEEEDSSSLAESPLLSPSFTLVVSTINGSLIFSASCCFLISSNFAICRRFLSAGETNELNVALGNCAICSFSSSVQDSSTVDDVPV